MASNSTISISFKMTEGADGLKTLVLNAADLKKVMGAAVREAEKLKKSYINFAAISTGIDSVSKSLTDLQSVSKGLSDAYAAQAQVETQLAVTMRNTMSARGNEIQSIKDLCSAQQELGVIGDEVQLAGAQELATYLSEKQSLEKLIPVMNDMLAQQYGLNASQENASQIATMLGKVMDGQTGALRRYGYTFDEAQEKILKYGDEAQRAAVLCDVVSASVGGMNAKLAKTDAGKLKQVENTLGDIKEKAGGLVQSFMPFLTVTANLTVAAGGIMKLTIAVKAATAAVAGWRIKHRAANLVIAATGLYSKKTALGLEMLCISAKGSERAIMALKLGLRGLMMATVVGAAVVALASAVSYLMDACDKAAESTNKLFSAEERAKKVAEEAEELRQREKSTLEGTRALLTLNIEKLKSFNGTKEQEKKLVGEMNDAYGETMGYFSSVADWYKALVSNSEAYCKQMIVEARTRVLADRLAKAEQEKYDLLYDEHGNRRKASKKRQTTSTDGTATVGLSGGFSANLAPEKEIVGSSDYEQIIEKQKAINSEIRNYRKQIAEAAKDLDSISMPVFGSKTRPDGSAKQHGSSIAKTGGKADSLVNPKELKTLNDFDAKLRYLNDLRGKATKDQIVWIDKAIERVTKLRKEFEGMGNSPKRPADVKRLKTIEDLEVAEKSWREIQQKGSAKEIIDAQKEINKITEKKNALLSLMESGSWQNAISGIKAEIKDLNSLDGKTLRIRLDSIGADKIKEQIKTIDGIIKSISAQMKAVGFDSEAYPELHKQREELRELRGGLKSYGEEASKAEQTESARKETVRALTGAFSGLGSAIGGAAGEWLSYGSSLVQTVATAIPQIVALTSAHKAEANANAENAATGAAASVASIPFVGPALAVAAIASIIAALAGIPKFATGGIVGGSSPSGDKLLARVNSGEMILNMAQQKKLFAMLSSAQSIRGVNVPQPQMPAVTLDAGFVHAMRDSSGGGGVIELKVKERELYGIMKKGNNLRKRS